MVKAQEKLQSILETPIVGPLGRDCIEVFRTLEMVPKIRELLNNYSPNVRSLFFVGAEETGNLRTFTNK